MPAPLKLPAVFSATSRDSRDGTPLGSLDGVAMTPAAPHPLTASTGESSYVPRQRDRRQALGDLLVALTRGLDRRMDPGLLRGTFEQMVKKLVPARAVHLRDAASRWSGNLEGPATGETVTLDVPGDPTNPGVLEARFNPGCGVGEWDFQTLGLAAHLAALVLEIERGRTDQARSTMASGRSKRDGAAPLIGSTPAMQGLRADIERVAATDFTVLLEGESGVGTELVAQQIHDLSRRRHGPFVAINCAALVETLLEAELFGIEDRTATGVRGRRGKFENADGGTLFLDEVSDLSASAQAKLLRAIQDLAVERVGGHAVHRVDIRIVAATNRGLAGLVERGMFRADLFYRLSGVDIRVPPLRERRTDILELARYFLARHRSMKTVHLSTGAADALMAYQWPGNVRELQRLMERALTLADSEVIDVTDLPLSVRGDYETAIVPALARNDSLRAWGSRYARIVLERCGGNKREACRVLRISYHTLQAYLRFPFHEPMPTDLRDPDVDEASEASAVDAAVETVVEAEDASEAMR
jgi:DNA-binding NtrC family response regulator